jgi:hypothetical protein
VIETTEKKKAFMKLVVLSSYKRGTKRAKRIESFFEFGLILAFFFIIVQLNWIYGVYLFGVPLTVAIDISLLVAQSMIGFELIFALIYEKMFADAQEPSKIPILTEEMSMKLINAKIKSLEKENPYEAHNRKLKDGRMYRVEVKEIDLKEKVN